VSSRCGRSTGTSGGELGHPRPNEFLTAPAPRSLHSVRAGRWGEPRHRLRERNRLNLRRALEHRVCRVRTRSQGLPQQRASSDQHRNGEHRRDPADPTRSCLGAERGCGRAHRPLLPSSPSAIHGRTVGRGSPCSGTRNHRRTVSSVTCPYALFIDHRAPRLTWTDTGWVSSEVDSCSPRAGNGCSDCSHARYPAIL
jgi:hypothetical protein